MSGAHISGETMRKTAILLAVLMAASSPAFAKAKKAKPAPKPLTQNEASAKLVLDALPLVLPTAAQAVYFTAQNQKK